MDEDGAAECKCLDGYFRNNESRFSDPDAEKFSDLPDELSGDDCTRESLTYSLTIRHPYMSVSLQDYSRSSIYISCINLTDVM